MPDQIEAVLAERVIRMLGEGRSVDFTAMSNRLTKDQVLDLAVRHGHPDQEKLLWAADIMAKNLKVVAREEAAAEAPAAPPKPEKKLPPLAAGGRIKPGPKPGTTPKPKVAPTIHATLVPSAPAPSGFDVFRRPTTNNSGSLAMVTLSKSGQILVNKAATDLIGDPEEVEVLWDATSKVIGIRPVPGRTSASFTVSRGTTGSRTISARAFFVYIGIDWTVSRRVLVYVRDGVLYVDTKA